MPASNYQVATADQLGGNAKIPRIRSKKQTILVKLDIPETKDLSHLRHEKRLITDRAAEQVDALPTALDVDPSRDIYFSPILESSSLASLSQPLSSPVSLRQGTITPSTSVGTDLQAKVDSSHQPAKPDKLTITIEQRDSIVKALVEARLIKSSLQNQHLDYDAAMTLSPGKGSALYSISNKTFATRKAQEIAPELRLLNSELGGACLFTNTAKDNLVAYTSAIRAIGSAKVGDCAAMSLPDGLDVAVRLEYQPGVSAQVTMQSVHSMIDRNKGECTHFLSYEESTTERFNKAALKELARISDVSVDRIEVVASSRTATEQCEDDWFALADQLQANCEAANFVDDTVKAIRSLDATTCTMQTLTLMAELSKIKACSSDIIVLFPACADENGRAKKTTAPFLSQSLAASVAPEALCVDAARAAAFTRGYIGTVVDAVYPCSYSEQEFEISDRAGLTSIIKCVPMYDDCNGRPKAWAVFIEPGVREALLRTGHL